MRKRALSSAGLLLATATLAAPAFAEKLKGYIWDVQGSTLVVEGSPVRLVATTQMERSNHPGVSAADLRIGWEVEVEGDLLPDGSLDARKLKVKNQRYQEIDVDGFIEGVRETSLYIDGRDTRWPKGMSRKAVSSGMQVKGKGIVQDDGSVELTRYEVKPGRRDKGEMKFLSLAAEELAKLKEKLLFYDDRLFQEYINRLGQRLVPDYVDRNEIRFNFSIVDDPDLNAFAMPDGTIVIHSGLAAVLENEAQLAAVLGHEIAHVTHKHGYRGYRHAQKLQWIALGAAVAGAAIDAQSGREPWEGPSLGTLLFEIGATLALTAAINGHGRNLEDDADRIGLRYVREAGYDPYQAPEVWRVFNKHIKDQNRVANWFFSDHSTHRARISNLTREINLNYRGKIDPASLTRNEEQYQRAVRRLARHNAIRDYQRKEYKNAEEAFRRILQEDPSDAVAHLYLGNIFRDTGGPVASSQALAEYQTAIRLDPELAEAHRELGLLYYGLGQYEQAVEAFQTYLRTAPQAPDAAQIRQFIRDISR